MSRQYQTSAKAEAKSPVVSYPGLVQRRWSDRDSSQPSQPVAAPPILHEALNLPIHSTGNLIIQPKLMIGSVGDKYEQEADRVAAQVVNQINTPQSSQRGEAIQRQGTKEEDDKLQMKPMLQNPSGSISATPELEAAIGRSGVGGQPLAENIRKPMEQVFGADFSQVKVHTDAQADQLNRSLQAKAFTTRQDVFFRQGTYEPGSRVGQELIAHELTHVVQQSTSSSEISGLIQRGKKSKTEEEEKVPKKIGETSIQPVKLKKTRKPKPKSEDEYEGSDREEAKGSKDLEEENFLDQLMSDQPLAIKGDEGQVAVQINWHQLEKTVVISRVVISGRTKSPYSGSMGAHTTSWKAISVALEKRLRTKDPGGALIELEKMVNEIFSDRRLAHTKELDTSHEVQLTKALKVMEDKLVDAKKVDNPYLLNTALQTLIISILTAENFVPFATIWDSPTTGNSEGSKSGKLEFYEETGKLPFQQSGYVGNNPQEVLSNLVWDLFDFKAAAQEVYRKTSDIEQRRKESQEKQTVAEEQINQQKEWQEKREIAFSQDALKDEERASWVLASLLNKFLTTIKDGYPLTYKNAGLGEKEVVTVQLKKHFLPETIKGAVKLLES